MPLNKVLVAEGLDTADVKGKALLEELRDLSGNTKDHALRQDAGLRILRG